MQIVLLIARLLLALVFGVAGVSKAADRDGSRRAMIGFGVPEKLAPGLAQLLPIVEIVIAVALIPLEFAWLGSIAAFIVLSIFASGIVFNLVRGRAPDCHCFGQLHSRPVGSSTLIRNVILMALAGLIIVQGKGNPGASALDWIEDLKPAEIVGLVLGTVAVALLFTGVVYARRILSQQSALLGRIDAMKKIIDEDYAEPPVERADAAPPREGLPVGAPAPSFALAAVGGEQTTLDDLLSYRKPILLLFVSPNCAPCKTVLENVRAWERNYGKHLAIVLLGKGTLKENQDLIAKYGVTSLLLQGESMVAEEYQAKWSPAAVLIRPDGKIASHMAYGDEAIRAMVTRLGAPPDDSPRKRSLEIKSNGHKPQIIIGTPHALADVGKLAPDFSLPDPSGNMVDSKDLILGDTLLLFWDPKCPFCKTISADIRRWEENPPVKAPRLVFVSMGEVEEVQAESIRFKSQFLLDPELDVGVLFGTNLTPSAVLIDDQGRIASAPEAGRVNILALAGAGRELLAASSV
jgi:thiol-disulfide isomerase/thioredoxin